MVALRVNLQYVACDSDTSFKYSWQQTMVFGMTFSCVFFDRQLIQHFANVKILISGVHYKLDLPLIWIYYKHNP